MECSRLLIGGIIFPAEKYFTTTINHCLTLKVYNHSYLIIITSTPLLVTVPSSSASFTWPCQLRNIEISGRLFNVENDVDLLKFMILMILMLCLLLVIGTLMQSDRSRQPCGWKPSETININFDKPI